MTLPRRILLLLVAALMVATMAVVTAVPAFSQDGKVTACHNTDNNPHEITVSENAWDAHGAHGDTLGAC